MITYRQACAYDAEALLEYLKKVGAQTDNLTFGKDGLPIDAEREAKILENLQKSTHSRMILALDGERIVGDACIEGTGNPRFRHRATLAISVEKAYWGQGIGTSLISRLISFAKDAGIEIISLDVRADNYNAIRLYEKFGFKRYGVFEKYFKIGSQYADAVYMNLYL